MASRWLIASALSRGHELSWTPPLERKIWPSEPSPVFQVMVVRPNRLGAGTGFGADTRYGWPAGREPTSLVPRSALARPITESAASSFEYPGPPKRWNSYLIPASIQGTSAEPSEPGWKSWPRSFVP